MLMKKAYIIIMILFIALTSSSSAARPESSYRALALDDRALEGVAEAVRRDAAGENYLVKVCTAAMYLNRIARGEAVPSPSGNIYDDTDEYLITVKLVYEYGIDPTCGSTRRITREEARGIEGVTIVINDVAFAREVR